MEGRASKVSRKVETIPYDVLKQAVESGGKGTYKLRELIGLNTRKDGEPSIFNYTKYVWAANSPYAISNKCCDVMKKAPMHKYMRRTGRYPMLATMASESKLRKTDWMRNGCNGFEMKRPRSNPMAFWMENDVLQYIKDNNIPIASVYGEIVEADELPGQMTWDEYAGFDTGAKNYTTTGCKRTGCMFCGYGCHLEKPGEGRFERMKETHPKQYEYIMKPLKEGGLGYKEVIDWLNENGNLHIGY